jgi:hypothetical protein
MPTTLTTDLPDSHARLGEYLIPLDARPTQCKSCQAAIVFTQTATGARIPLSLATIRLGADGKRYALSHFSDCPHADQHRKPTTSKPIDLRDLPHYLDTHHLVATGSTLSDDGKGRLTIVLHVEERKA